MFQGFVLMRMIIHFAGTFTVAGVGDLCSPLEHSKVYRETEAPRTDCD